MLAWGAPHLLETGRYRASVAAFASLRLGRPVELAGPIRLALLPEPVISAERVRIPNRGDGLFAEIGALRLRVAFLPLLAGRLSPRDLGLEAPVLHLPWPVPGSAIEEAASAIPLGFSATVRHGTVVVGTTAMTDVAGTLQRDPDTASFHAAVMLKAFGQPWHLTGLLGRPTPAGRAPLSLALDQASPGRLSAHFSGQVLPSGDLTGDARAAGVTLPAGWAAEPVDWDVSGPVSASAQNVTAADLRLRIGRTPGRASVTLALPKPHLAADLALGSLDLSGWQAGPAKPSWPTLPFTLTLKAEAANFRQGTVRHVVVSLSHDPGGAHIALSHVELPGHLILQGSADDPAGRDFAGHFTLRGSDAVPALRWLGLPESLLGQLPPSPLAASFDGSWNGAIWNATGITGRFGPRSIAGRLSLESGLRPHLEANLATDQLDLASLFGLGRAAYAADLDITAHLTAREGVWNGIRLTDPRLDARLDAAGLHLAELAFGAAGSHAAASAELRRDGTVESARLRIDAPDAAHLLPLIPARFRLWPRLWTGPAVLAVDAAGPSSQLDLALRASLGDLELQLQSRIDLAQQTWKAGFALRHPGAPRLLAALGLPDPADAIDSGSFTLAGHGTGDPHRIDLDHVALGAGLLRASGQLTADLDDAGEPAIAATIEAERLALPPCGIWFPVLLQRGWKTGWHGAIHIESGPVSVGLREIFQSASTDLLVGGGNAAFAGFHGEADAQRYRGDLVLDGSVDPPRLAASIGASPFIIANPPSGLPISLGPASGDAEASLTAEGHTASALLATLAGSLQGQIRDATLTGIDLAAKSRARTRGSTAGLSGTFDATLDHGLMELAPTRLAGPLGAIDLQGDIDLANRLANVRVLAEPERAADLAVRVVGPWRALREIRR